MATPRTVILLGADAGALLAPGTTPFRDALRREDVVFAESLARVVRGLGGAEPGSPRAPEALALLALLDLDREHRKGHNRHTLGEARRALLGLGEQGEREAVADAAPASALAACIGPGDTVIALGPEERLESALNRLSWPASWAPADGYGLSFRRALSGDRSNLRVLKLRGSLGWLYCRKCRALFASSPLGGDGDAGGPHPCVHPHDEREGVVAGVAMRGTPRSAFLRIRAAAAAALARADRVVLVGEAPGTDDPFVAWVLRRSASTGKRRPQIVAAGPAAAAEAGRLATLLGVTGEPTALPEVTDLVSALGRPGSLF